VNGVVSGARCGMGEPAGKPGWLLEHRVRLLESCRVFRALWACWISTRRVGTRRPERLHPRRGSTTPMTRGQHEVRCLKLFPHDGDQAK
jgi:hypothetical protein